MAKRVIILFGSFVLYIMVAYGKQQPFGINLCGGEFGENYLPGTYNVHYRYPSFEDVDYFADKGFKLVDIPFKWERIQKTPGGMIDAAELNLIDDLIAYCGQRNIKVILSMHNFGRYRWSGNDYIIGSRTIPRQYFTEVWKQISTRFKKHSNIYAYDIMSEPHHMGEFSWFETAQQTINAIRKADSFTPIMIAGNNYADIEHWVQQSDELKYLTDPSNKIIFDAHCYFDFDYSGRYRLPYEQNKVNEHIGIKRAKPFIHWLKANNKKGFIGEYGVPYNDARWLKALDIFLQYLNENDINGNYWAAGPMWDEAYTLSVKPRGGEDKPQMSILTKYKFTGYYVPLSGYYATMQPLPANTKSNVWASTELKTNNIVLKSGIILPAKTTNNAAEAETKKSGETMPTDYWQMNKPKPKDAPEAILQRNQIFYKPGSK